MTPAPPFDAKLASFVASIDTDALGGHKAERTIERVADNLYRVELVFTLPEAVKQDDWQVRIAPTFTPTWHWSPHLTPTDEHIIDQHSFRSPALIMASADKVLHLIPDLDLLAENAKAKRPRWYLDLDAPARKLTLGMSRYDTREHVLYVRKPGAVHPAGEAKIGFYLRISSSPEDIANPFRPVLAQLWKQWGHRSFAAGQPLGGDLAPYVEQTYAWAFGGWRDAVWQQFELNGRTVGAPVFIVNHTQSPNYPGEVDEREFRSIWNQAWFSSLRSASGLYRHAHRHNDKELLRRAELAKELALAAPQEQGIFPSVIATEMEEVEIDGRRYKRSKGWNTAFWGNSDRNPINRPAGKPRIDDVRIAPYHVLDMSWTALLMLRWHSELGEDARLVAYARRYADALLKLQDDAGFFPAWLDKDTRKPLGVLDRSPETSMSVTFLLKAASVTGNTAYRRAALRALEAVARDIITQGRWEDFETYWSCSAYGVDSLIGKRVTRNAMYKQNNFSMFWTAEALYEAFLATGQERWLKLGRRVLDELLMTQASWQPPYMYVSVLGGFGVMNGDAEWNDARGSLFAELIVAYGKQLGDDEYIERGLAALRATFVMMYSPLNPITKTQWEKRHPFFGPEDYGFTMENYGHNGKTGPEGTGMGVFTIYDWGNGAAAEAYNRMLDHLGKALVHR